MKKEVKATHGGTRKGSGRKAVDDSLKKKQRAVYITDETQAFYDSVATKHDLANLSEVLVFISTNYSI